MSPAPLSRRARELRLPAIGVLAAALMLAAIAVLFVIGLWASHLGSPPGWAFDCNDTTCTDLRADARHHYLRVAAGACITALLAAVLGSLAVPRRAGPRRAGPRHALRRMVAPFFLTAAALWAAGWLAVGISRPFGLAVALLAVLLAFLSAWRRLRPEPLTHLQTAEPAAHMIGLAPGDSARSRLYWPGYRAAADQETVQALTVRIDPAKEPAPVRFLPTPYGDDPGPAPFDLKAGVEGGAVIEIGPWEAVPSSAD